jgi:type II secretory ATPase GspE/PulE/Tfp pilus assembly ATPase PilB-like protein
LVLNQRLLRRRCAECSGKGCAACLDTGYRGRLPLVEWLRLNDALRRRIAERDLDGVAAQITLAESARSLVQAGLTTEAEVARVLGFQEGKAGPLVGG